MQQIPLAEAAHCLPNLIDAALNGEDIVITKNDQAAVRLVVTPPPKPDLTKREKRRLLFGSAKGLMTVSDDFDEPLEDFKGYM
jgi:antitoxin (DNA-binding transcriptional repressor) of toxin-antitoxin stability system